jgi:anti-sigma regulatory factor (Ser/Thr protein kinase)
MASLFLPCAAVGGDLYDVIQISEDLIGFYIFSVSTQGVASALLSSLAKVSFLKNIHSLTSPKAVLERINEELLETICSNFFITAFVAFLDLHSNKLIYCNAGHTYPVIYKRNEKKLIPLKTAGAFLGVYKDAEFENDSVYLFPDDWFFLFTDGIYHLFNTESDESARKQLEEIISKAKYKSPSEFLDTCKKRFKNLSATRSQKRDVTAIVVEILTQSRRDQLKRELGFEEEMPVYLQFISYYEEIDAVSAHILRDMDETGYSDESIRKMKLTITELLANAIGHGNKDDHSKKVAMGHIVENTVVTVAVKDEGEGFDPSGIPDPTLPENLIKDHGRGLYIVRNHVDEIHFNKKGNRVLIRKYRFGKRENGFG